MRLFLGKILAAFGEYVKAPKSAFCLMFSDSKILRLFTGGTLCVEPQERTTLLSTGLPKFLLNPRHTARPSRLARAKRRYGLADRAPIAGLK